MPHNVVATSQDSIQDAATTSVPSQAPVAANPSQATVAAVTLQATIDATSVQASTATSIQTTCIQATWPAETDIVVNPITNRVTLTTQHPLLRTVIQEAIENLRASLLFDDAFPNAIVTPLAIRECLMSAADNPKALMVKMRLTSDERYLTTMIRLVSLSFQLGCD